MTLRPLPLRLRFIALYFGPVLFVVCLNPLIAFAQSDPAFRLSKQVTPVAYGAELTLHPSETLFQGKVSIDLKVAKPTQAIWLNGTNLTVKSAELQQGGVGQQARVIIRDEDFIGFQVRHAIRRGKARLRIVYSGRVSDGGDGLFRHTYKDKTYLLTQFEPDAARRVFPCFDEPGFKAPWRMVLHIPRKDVGLTNGRVETVVKESNGMKRITFAETRPLPTYLIALAVGPFDVVDAGRAGKNHTPIRIITPNGESANAVFAAETAPHVLEWFERYLGIPYQFGKLDLVANPGCSSGGMEHPGLITFCAPQMLAPPGNDYPARQRDFTRVLAHELAHQWFGNLVTPAWWDDLWLSEGFANWFQGRYINAAHPEWNFQAVELRNRLLTMEQDGMPNTLRLHEPVDSKEDIHRVFSPIAYVKGAALLEMLDAAAGDEEFRRTLKQYLANHEFGTSTSKDLVEAIRANVSPELANVAKKFIDQPGVPLIRTTLKCAARQAPAIEVKQARAVSVPDATLSSESWDIPLCFEYWAGGIHHQCAFLESSRADIRLAERVTCPKWVLPNPGAKGYLRVAYQEDELNRLVNKGWGELDLVDQLAVLNDLSLEVLDGSVPASEGLSIVRDIIGALPPDGVTTALDIVRRIGMMVPIGSRNDYARYVRKTFGEEAQKLGWRSSPGEDFRERSLRSGLVPFVAIAGDDQQLQIEAHELAAKWLAQHSSVDSDVVATVLMTAAHSGTVSLFDQYLIAFHHAENPRERRWVVMALGGFDDPNLENRAEGLLLSHEVTPQAWLTLMTSRTDHSELAIKRFQFVKDNVDALLAAADIEDRKELLSQLPNVADGACSEKMASEVEDFFRPRLATVPGGNVNLDDVEAGIRACARRQQLQGSKLREFLMNQ